MSVCVGVCVCVSKVNLQRKKWYDRKWVKRRADLLQASRPMSISRKRERDRAQGKQRERKWQLTGLVEDRIKRAGDKPPPNKCNWQELWNQTKERDEILPSNQVATSSSWVAALLMKFASDMNQRRAKNEWLPLSGATWALKLTYIYMYIYTFTYSKKKKRKERWQRKIDYSTSRAPEPQPAWPGEGEGKRDSINIVRSGERVPPDGCCFHFYSFPPDAAAVDKKKMHSQWQLFTVLVI